MFVLTVIFSICSSGHDAELAVLLICFGLSSMRYIGLKKPALIHIWDKNDLDRYLCTTCSLQYLASTWVHSCFFMGSMLLIFLVFRIVYFLFVLLVLVLCIYLENIFLHCSIVLLLTYILMIGLYIYTNNIQWYSHISQAC
jgi:hypothetical protein